jgi:hypothetical protein
MTRPESSGQTMWDADHVQRLSARARGRIAVVLIVLGGASLVVGSLAVYAERNLLDADRFADRAVDSLDDESVRDVIGVTVAEQLERKVDRDLIAVRPVVETVASGIADTSAIRGALRAGISQAHQVALGKGKDTAAVTIANIGVIADEALSRLSPRAAKQIPDGFDATLTRLSEAGPITDVVQVADDVSVAAVIAPALAVILFVLAVIAAADRRPALLGVGIAISVAGALVVVAYAVGQAVAAGAVDGETNREAVRAVWSSMLGDLKDASLALCFAGAILAGAAASLTRPVDLPRALDRVRDALAWRPASRAGQVLKGAALLGAGVLILISPQVTLELVALALGLGLAFVGASELLAMIAPAPSADASDEPASRFGPPAALVALAAVAGTIVVLIAFDDDSRKVAQAAMGCNGSQALCDTPLNEVSFPASHNAMSAADYPGYTFPMHVGTIPQQLADGVRGLLIDAYYGYPGRLVFTDFERSPNKLIAEVRMQLGPDFVEAADRLRSRIAQPEGEESQLYLCHGFCELGAVPLIETLREIDGFVEEHPSEVLLIDIEDYVAPEDIVSAFEESGLAEHAYDGPLGPDFPTLGELVDSGKQVVVLAENRSGAAPWYRSTYDYFQETEYSFKTPEEMDCSPNRGDPDNPLFLINNWIDTDPAAKPSNAAEVNARDFLLDRARHCARQRGLVPNLIAVDFYDEGDLFGVTDALNRGDEG